ncbi:taurine dioxygenase family protein, partial [Penicillium capsulatum]
SKGEDGTAFPEPLHQSGALEQFAYEDNTPVIGREFRDLNVVNDLLNAPNADALIRDLAITISQRGVVFLRNQDNLTEYQQRRLIARMGELSGKPVDSSFFINPIVRVSGDGSTPTDPEITRIDSRGRPDFAATQPNPRRFDEALWHADGQFETCPPSFTSLRLTEVPRNGGDTLWASGYEMYDRFSKPYRTFLEGLSATFIGDGYIWAADQTGGKMKIHEGPRGSPLNVGKELKAVHPVVRTHPVSGWKSLFPVGPRNPWEFGSPKYINELHPNESDELLKRFSDMILQNHDLTVRFKWKDNDMGKISMVSPATFDYEGNGERAGVRIAGAGEKPYFDPHSRSRTEVLTGQP